MHQDLGSYDYSILENEDSELKRLKLQASFAKILEQPIFTYHGLEEGMDILDLGCGPGFTSRVMAEMSKYGKVLGLDLNTDLLSVAQSELIKSPCPNLEFQYGNIYDLSAIDRKFDFVHSRFVFQHLEDPVKAMQEVYRLLKPGGTFLIVDVDDSLVSVYPEHETYKKIFDLQQNYQKEQGGDRFVGRKLSHYFHQAGFDKVCNQVNTISSEFFGISTFIELTIGYKVVFLNQNQNNKSYISKEEVKQLHQDCKDSYHSGMVGIYNVSAKKPL